MTDLQARRAALWDGYIGRTDRIVDYAAAVTRHLSTIRATATPNR
jgi:hypothetical protein